MKREEPIVVSGNDLTLLRDGEETFPAMLEAITAARRFVHLEVYAFRDDHVGRAFCDALCERARAGIQVRVLYDGAGSFLTPEPCFARIRKAGGEVLDFAPLAPWRRRWSLRVRDHRKILVVDGEVGFAGGLNLDVCHASRSQGGHGWRDTHARFRGPAVVELERHFREAWRASWDRDARPLPELPAPAAAGDVPIAIVANGLAQVRSPIRRAYLDAIRAASARVWITNPYFLPDARLVHALVEAARRRVDVRILVPARSDMPLVDIAARPIFRHLVARGVRVFQYRRAVLHAKTAVVDGRWATVGSFNLDPMSFRNLELNVVVPHAGIAATMELAFQRDLEASTELLPTKLVAPVPLRMAEWTLYGLRRWM